MDTMYVKIDGVKIELVKDSLDIDTWIEERSVASFQAHDRTATDHYQRGQPVAIYDADDALVFGGFIDTPEELRHGPGLVHSITCMDNHYLADKRIAAETYQDTAAGTIVEDLRSTYLDAEGVTAGTIQAGPTLVAVVLNYVNVAQALDALAAKSGFTWEIDKDKALHFLDRSTNLAPFAITGDRDIVKGSARRRRGNSKYRNRQYVRGGKAVTDIQTENHTGDGIRKSWTLGYPVAAVPTITVDGSPVTVGVKGLDTGFDFYWSKGDEVIVSDSAVANNDAIVVTYTGTYNVVTISDDEAAIIDRQTVEGSGTGIVEDVINDTDVDSAEQSLEIGAAALSKFAVVAVSFGFDTRNAGLKVGQLLTVTYAPFDLSAVEMLIESIRIIGEGEQVLYKVLAVAGPVNGSWTQLFAQLSAGLRAAVDSSSIGEDSILHVLVTESEEWGWTEGVVPSVFACSVPSPTLFPSATLFPC